MQLTPNTPNKSLQSLEFCTPIGTEEVRLEGTTVSGRWLEDSIFSGLKNRLLLEDFVNWPDSPAEIARFTRTYGPLYCDREAGSEFNFSLEGWRHTQQRFRELWEVRSGRRNLTTTLGGGLPYQLIFRGGKLLLWANHLEGYLRLELFTAPAERFRKCERPGCETPYFVARHLKQTYCSTLCAKWAQAQWKKNWWGDKGSDWLAARKKKAKGKSSRRTKR